MIILGLNRIPAFMVNFGANAPLQVAFVTEIISCYVMLVYVFNYRELLSLKPHQNASQKRATSNLQVHSLPH
jgi:hypothetical protein